MSTSTQTERDVGELETLVTVRIVTMLPNPVVTVHRLPYGRPRLRRLQQL